MGPSPAFPWSVPDQFSSRALLGEGRMSSICHCHSILAIQTHLPLLPKGNEDPRLWGCEAQYGTVSTYGGMGVLQPTQLRWAEAGGTIKHQLPGNDLQTGRQ